MATVFLWCAIIGTTILALQLIMTLIGMGSESLDMDTEVPDDVSLDVDADAAADLGNIDDQLGSHLDSSWMFQVLSFRTLIAAFAFFGIFGRIGFAFGLTLTAQLLLAIAGGAMAMYGVAWMLQLLRRMGQDGTLRIDGTIGKVGTVYIPIPARRSAAGKIQIRHQNRIAEYAAMTAHPEKLPTGARVQVVGIIGQGTVDVVLADATANRGEAMSQPCTA